MSPPASPVRTLSFASIALTTCFFAWFAFAPLAPFLQREMGLSNIQLGWLTTAGVALTIPGRLVVGALVDRFGPRKTFAWLLALLSVPVALLSIAQGFHSLLLLRLLIGLVGCGFVVGIRLVADWFPPKKLGLAEGIYGGWGNAGSGMAAVALPILAVTFGWRVALAAAALPMLVVSVLYWRNVRDVPPGRIFRRPSRDARYSPWTDPRAQILALAYLACFGSEICVVGFLPKLFVDRYALSPLHAGLLASIFGLANAYARPIGGALADRLGRQRVLIALLTSGGLAYVLLGVARSLTQSVVGVVLASTLVQGACGAVFAIVPLVSPTSTGRVAGVVGAAGNVGGMLFPLAFGYGLAWTDGSYLPGFAAVALACGVAALAVTRLRGAEGDHEAHDARAVAADSLRPTRVRMAGSLSA